MKEGRRFSMWKFLPDARTSTIRVFLSRFDDALRSWYGQDPKFANSIQLALQWKAPPESQRFRVVVDIGDEQERWYVRLRGAAVPHIVAAMEHAQTPVRVIRNLPSPELTKILLGKGAIDIGVPEPGGTSYGRTSAIYVRLKLWGLPAGRLLLEEPIMIGAKAPSGDIFAVLEDVFRDAKREDSSVPARSASIRSFLKDCDQLINGEAKDRFAAALAPLRIAPEDWWRATTP